VEHGSNNVSRWMTWLPISLKNAAKCDKWYQLQNHPITESLNAKGAREKISTVHPRACRISVSNKQKKYLTCICGVLPQWACLCLYKRESGALCVTQRQCFLWWGVFARRVTTLSFSLLTQSNKTKTHNVLFFVYLWQQDTPHMWCKYSTNFVYRPECGRTTRRT